MRRTLGTVLAAVALALVMVGGASATGLIGAPHVVVDPQALVTYAGIIRYPATGAWEFVADGTHVAAGFTGISCDPVSGTLTVSYAPLASIASAWVSDDETQARRGIFGGPSAGLDHMNILFTQMTANGPVAVNCSKAALRGRGADFWIGVIGVPAVP